MAEPASQPDPYSDLIEVGNLMLNLGNYQVTVDGQPVELTYHEFDLLRLLAANADRIVDFRALTQALWMTQGHKELRRLNVLAFRLRQKLNETHPFHLVTVRGRGYGLVKSMEPRSHHE